jgi:hypothetical protein
MGFELLGQLLIAGLIVPAFRKFKEWGATDVTKAAIIALVCFIIGGAWAFLEGEFTFANLNWDKVQSIGATVYVFANLVFQFVKGKLSENPMANP